LKQKKKQTKQKQCGGRAPSIIRLWLVQPTQEIAQDFGGITRSDETAARGYLGFFPASTTKDKNS
jgi:hypothetical protein